MRFFSSLFITTLNVSGFFLSRSKSPTVKIGSSDCCFPPKINVNWKRANLGKAFLRQLTIDADIYDEVTPESMCHLVHFLFQQASINGKSVTVSEEMFVLFDDSDRVLDRISQSKGAEQYPMTVNGFRFRHFLNRLYELKKPDARLEKRYPVYGMDVPESCLPNNFDRILFGELPSISSDQHGQRLFIKPDRAGLEVSSVIKQTATLAKQRFCRLVRGETKSDCVKIRVFKANADKIMLRKWMTVLSKLPPKLQLDQKYKRRANKYGIYEVVQQLTDLEAAGAGRDVKNFRKLLTQKYGHEDIRLRQGQEIIFTTMGLKQSHVTCESYKDLTRC